MTKTSVYKWSIYTIDLKNSKHKVWEISLHDHLRMFLYIFGHLRILSTYYFVHILAQNGHTWIFVISRLHPSPTISPIEVIHYAPLLMISGWSLMYANKYLLPILMHPLLMVEHSRHRGQTNHPYS